MVRYNGLARLHWDMQMHLLHSKRRARSLLGKLLSNTRLSNERDQMKKTENVSNAEMVEAKPIIISATLTSSVQNAAGKITDQSETATVLEADSVKLT